MAEEERRLAEEAAKAKAEAEAEAKAEPEAKTEAKAEAKELDASRLSTAGQTLVLSGVGLREIPAHFNSSTVDLDVSDNQISTLPAGLLQCQSLRTLNLKGNMLERLPVENILIAALRYLDVSENKLSSLPSGVGELRLKTLSAAGNQLTSLPESLVNITSLVELDVGGNQLTELPQAIGSLPSLTFLDVSENQIIVLPESVVESRSLNDLRCMNNSFSEEALKTIDDATRFTDPEHIYKALGPQDGDIKETPMVQLVRSSWLVQRAEALKKALAEADGDTGKAETARNKWKLPRRQELPDEAFIYEKELRQLTSKRARIAVAAVSQ